MGAEAPAGPAPKLDIPAALDAAMRYLAPTARSCSEVRRHLRREGFGDAVASAAEARLVELGILDDREFARSWIEQFVLRRHESVAKAEHGLAARGVDPEVIAEAVAEVCPDEGELGGALAAGADRLRVLRGPPAAIRRRLGGYLARRGYDAEVIGEVCSRLLGERALD